MKNQLVSFKTAQLAKEKGFDWLCDTVYFLDGSNRQLQYFEGNGMGLSKNSLDGFYASNSLIACTRPQQSLLQKWLRDIHNIVIQIIIFDKGFLTKEKYCYQYIIGENEISQSVYKTYEKALEEAFYETLKLIKI